MNNPVYVQITAVKIYEQKNSATSLFSDAIVRFTELRSNFLASLCEYHKLGVAFHIQPTFAPTGSKTVQNKKENTRHLLQ